MITFTDGPAAGRSLLLRRAPIYLRITRNPLTGEFDGLDQPEDEPLAHEEITVYVIQSAPGRCHLHRRGGGGGWYAVGTYALAPEQPPDASTRETESWRAWCRAQFDAAKEHGLPPSTIFTSP